MAAGKKASAAAPGNAGKKKVTFSKEQLLTAERFQGRRDIVDALLSAEGGYAADDVEQMIENYMKGKVE